MNPRFASLPSEFGSKLTSDLTLVLTSKFKPRFTGLALVALSAMAACALPAQAQNLTDLYQAARSYDAGYQSAAASAIAALARGEQSKAGVLPVANFQVGASRSVLDASSAASTANFGGQNATISASYPLFRPANWVTYAQGEKQEDIAKIQLQVAEQDLIIRTSQAYFDVLAALDTLTFVLAQRAAIQEQLASAKRNFEVGTSTITDTREAQARFDLVDAQKIAAEYDIRVKKMALDQLVGKNNVEPRTLVIPLTLPMLAPNDVTQWVERSETSHPSIAQAKIALELAQLETTKAELGHKPTLDLNASLGVNRNEGSATNKSTTRSNSGTVALAFNWPLFAGFAVQNRIKETIALEDKARADLDVAKRAVAQATRAAFFGVQSGLSSVKAIEAAEFSSQSALDANKLGYQVGVRINIDVLNAQSQLFQTKRDLAKARYDVLLGGLKLRQANGTLTAEDLAPVNALLAK
jgi:outer membrane protein